MQTLVKRKLEWLFKSDKLNSKTRNITESKKRQFIMIKGSILHEDIIFLNVHTSNGSISKYMRQK